MYSIAMGTINDANNSADEIDKIVIVKNVGNKEFDLEEILSDLGAFGKFQIIIYSLTILPILLISCLGLSYIFTTGQLEYRFVKYSVN